MTAAVVTISLEALCAAYRELTAAHDDWTRPFNNVRETLRYEDLMPVAQRLDRALTRFLKASAPLTADCK